MKKNKTIAIALSGGIDSLVAAYILKQQYTDIFGIHFQTGYENRITDLRKAQTRLGIDIKYVDLSKDFHLHVINYFIATYLKGMTPNPCVICNKKIKFDALYKAVRTFGADLIATGHYAGIQKDRFGHNCLVKAKDLAKDQSYFLAMLSREQLNRTIFPLKGMYKSEVKTFAASHGLVPPEKEESQDICFIKQQSFAEFISLQKNIKPTPGKIIRTNGEIVGTHNGLHQFTIGQRRGLNCPGPAPYYVKKIDIKNNTLVVGFKEELFKKELYVNNIHWTGDPITCIREIKTKIRYHHQEVKSVFIPHTADSSDIRDAVGTDIVTLDTDAAVNTGSDALYPGTTSVKTDTGIIPNDMPAKIIFNEPQYAVTPGQIAVFYSGNAVLGCGTIH